MTKEQLLNRLEDASFRTIGKSDLINWIQSLQAKDAREEVISTLINSVEGAADSCEHLISYDEDTLEYHLNGNQIQLNRREIQIRTGEFVQAVVDDLIDVAKGTIEEITNP